MGPPKIGNPYLFFLLLPVQILSGGLECDLSLRPAPLSFSPSHQMENDASKVGWGAYAHSNSFTQGKWSITEAKLHINYLELFAVLLGTKALFPGSSITSLMILCDNISAVNYIYRMGGTKSCANSLVLRDYSLSQHWAKKQILPWFRYIRPDTMSRVFLDNHKYFLSHMALPSLLSNRLLPRFRPLCCLHSSSFITLLPFT